MYFKQSSFKISHIWGICTQHDMVHISITSDKLTITMYKLKIQFGWLVDISTKARTWGFYCYFPITTVVILYNLLDGMYRVLYRGGRWKNYGFSIIGLLACTSSWALWKINTRYTCNVIIDGEDSLAIVLNNTTKLFKE